MIDTPRTRRRRDERAAYALLSPFLALLLVFTFLPTAATFWLAWWRWDPLAEQEWAGAGNFTRLAADPRFWNAAQNTIAITLIVVVAQLVIGLGLAHVAHEAASRWVRVVQMSFLIPFVTSGAAVTILVAQLIDPDHGAVPRGLALIGLDDVDLLSMPPTAWAVVAGIVVWRGFGFTALLMLATLSATPRELSQAAELDGAGSWHRFRFLTIPLLGPVIVFTSLTSAVAAVQTFAEPLMIDPATATCGPARQCQTLAMLVYEIGFRESQFGYAAAAATAVFVLSAFVVASVYLVSRAWVRTG